MHIVIATPLSPPQAGGPSYYSEGLRTGFEAEGHTVTLVSFSRYRGYPMLVRHLAFALGLLIPLRRADLVVALDTWSVALPAVLTARLLRKRAVVRSGGDFLWERFVERTKREVPLFSFYRTSQPLSFYERCIALLTQKVVFGLADTLVFSTQWQRSFTSVAYSIPKSKTRVIENVLPERVHPTEPTGKLYVWIGRPLFLKNTARLKHAFEKAKRMCPDIELTLLANVSQEEAHRALAHAWAFVLPSLSEVSPNLVSEALSLAVPVICTQETGIQDSLRDSVLFVDPLNEDDIAAKIVEISDPAVWQRWRDRTRMCTWGRTYRDIAHEYLVLFGT